MSKERDLSNRANCRPSAVRGEKISILAGRIAGEAFAVNGAAPVKSTDRYVSRDYYEREIEKIWKDSWLLIGRERDVARPGEYVTFNMGWMKTAIVVVRGQDGQLRGFYNYCKHRGQRLCNQAKGRSKLLVCPFHGWGYSHEGELVALAQRKTFARFDKNEVRLTPVHVDTWGGFVFVYLNEHPKDTLAEFMRGLPSGLEPYLRDRNWTWFAGQKITADANWKIGIDGALDAYHPNTTHDGTMFIKLEPEDVHQTLYNQGRGPVGRLMITQPKMIKRALSFMKASLAANGGSPPPLPMPAIPGLPNMGSSATPDELQGLKLSLVEALAAKNARINMFWDKDSSAASAGYERSINEDSNPHWMFEGYSIFPNTFLVLSQDEIMLQQSWPVAVDRSQMMNDFYYIDEPRNFAEMFARMQKNTLAMDIIAEDMHPAMNQQQAFASGTVTKMYMHGLEALVAAYEQRIDEAMR